MSIGIIEALQDWHVTFADLPQLKPELKARFERILSKLEEWIQKKQVLQEMLLKETGLDGMNAMLMQWDIIFEKIIGEEFTHEYWWVEAKDKYWNDYKNQNLNTFWSHRLYNMTLDGLEKTYWRHIPRKSEQLPEIVRMLEIAKYKRWVEEHYSTHEQFLIPWESQD